MAVKRNENGFKQTSFKTCHGAKGFLVKGWGKGKVASYSRFCLKKHLRA